MDKVAAHTLELTVHVPEWVPTHADRTESSLFHQNRQRLIEEGHGYCWGCRLAGRHVTDDVQLLAQGEVKHAEASEVATDQQEPIVTELLALMREMVKGGGGRAG